MRNSRNLTRSTAQGSPLADHYLLRQIEGRWILRILLCLNKGEHRFSDLREAIPPISASVLTERIRSLESAGLVERLYLPPPSASQVYRLTPSAAGLRPALDALASWQSDPRASHGLFTASL
jgi:DNA-binding HxlR family transcriptional regulator